jgi:GGDEF domain-containing protein
VIEIELAEIENRMSGYSGDAQADIRWLVRELRKVYNLGTRSPEPPASAIYDSLTGLLSGGASGLGSARARARPGRYRKIFAVMSIELTQAHGQEALSDAETDELLKQVAERLAGIARATDTLARIDQQKFAMILEELTYPEHAERVKQKVEAALAEPFMLWERGVSARAAVTLQFYPSAVPEGTRLN